MVKITLFRVNFFKKVKRLSKMTNKKLIDTDNSMVITREWGGEVGGVRKGYRGNKW